MEKAKLTRSEAAIQLIAFADEKMDLTDQEAAAALTLAACFLAGGNAENILSIIRLVFATADVMRETWCIMREREILREWAKSERLKNFQKMQQREAERNLRGSVFRVARMLFLHNLIETLFGRKK